MDIKLNDEFDVEIKVPEFIDEDDLKKFLMVTYMIWVLSLMMIL